MDFPDAGTLLARKICTTPKRPVNTIHVMKQKLAGDGKNITKGVNAA